MKELSNVLVITLENDAHVPFVRKYFDDLIILDPSKIIDGVELTYFAADKGIKTKFGSYFIENIKSVWYRRPYVPLQEDINVKEDYKGYAQSAVQRHIRNLYSLFSDAYWLSDYYKIIKAENKARQLELARVIGFNVPSTIFTSDEKAAAKFIKEKGIVITKSMATKLPFVNKKPMYFYTTKISADNMPSLSGLKFAPAIFQELIKPIASLRITVVGKQVFAASVHEQDDSSDITDWRRSYRDRKLKFEKYKISKDLEEKCLKLTKELDLEFGAIDVLVDKNNKAWFLEINPNGQWAFIEEDTDLEIGKAIAGLLTRGNKS